MSEFMLLRSPTSCEGASGRDEMSERIVITKKQSLNTMATQWTEENFKDKKAWFESDRFAQDMMDLRVVIAKKYDYMDTQADFERDYEMKLLKSRLAKVYKECAACARVLSTAKAEISVIEAEMVLERARIEKEAKE